jgi:putative transposase
MGLGRIAADRGNVSPKLGCKSKLTQSPLKSEAHAVPFCQRWVVHVATTLGISLLQTGNSAETVGDRTRPA